MSDRTFKRGDVVYTAEGTRGIVQSSGRSVGYGSNAEWCWPVLFENGNQAEVEYLQTPARYADRLEDEAREQQARAKAVRRQR